MEYYGRWPQRFISLGWFEMKSETGNIAGSVLFPPI